MPIPGSNSTTLAVRLPPDLVGTVDPRRVPPSAPFVALYQTEIEYAAEMSNRTVHSIMHLAWAPLGDGVYQAQMAVYTRPRGALGCAYMEIIKPFRYAFVYPDLMRLVDRAWRRQTNVAEVVVDRGAESGSGVFESASRDRAPGGQR